MSINAINNIRVDSLISELEQRHGFTVLYAAEAGSRCWGMESPDSDFDVRMVYVYPDDRYLSLREPPDVVQHVQDDLDVSGWDVRKAIRLLVKSNASLVEWFHSPVVYRDWLGSYGDAVRGIMRDHVGLGKLAHHYVGLSEGHMHKYLLPSTNIDVDETRQVSIKKLLYMVRCDLTADYILIKKQIPPVRFEELTKVASEDEEREIKSLIDVKKKSSEGDMVDLDTARKFFTTNHRVSHQQASALMDQAVPESILEHLLAYSRWMATQMYTT